MDRHENRAAPAANPADERRRQQGLTLAIRLLAMLRTGRAYQTGNQVFRQQVESFLEAAATALDETAEATLVTLDNDLYLNGVRLPIKSGNYRHHEQLIGEFRRRQIAGLRMLAGVTVTDVERFFDFFLRPHDYAGPGLLEACLAAGLSRILPAVHASTEADGGGDAFVPSPGGYDAGGDGGFFGGSGSGGGGGGGGGDGDEPTRAAPNAPPGPRGGARKSFQIALQGARSLLTTTSLEEGVELRRAKRVVQPLVDGAFAAEPVVLGLSSLGHHDEYTYAHAVNVCMVAVTMGFNLRLDRRSLADLGVASLLHDVGKAAVASRIEHPLEAFTPEERAAAEQHPAHGARLIAQSTVLNQTTLRSMRVALEHHQTADGGYPPRAIDEPPSVLSRIVGVADAYVSLSTHRSERGRDVTPYEALGMMLGPMRHRFDPGLLWALVQSLGFYPPGQMVELDDHAVGVVIAPDIEDLARPHVRIVVRGDGSRPAEGEIEELRPVPQERRIIRALPAKEYPEL